MSDYVPVSDRFMQDSANGKDGWDTSMPDLNDDMIEWSKFIDFDAPAGAQPTISADYDAQGGLDPDFGREHPQAYAPGILGWDPAPLYGPHTGMGLSPATGTRGSALNEPSNDASYYGYDTNLLTTEGETVPSHDAGMLDSENSLADPPIPQSSSKDETWLGITDDNAALSSGKTRKCIFCHKPDDNAAPSPDTPCKCIVCLNLGNRGCHEATKLSRTYKALCRFPACPMAIKGGTYGRDVFYWTHAKGIPVHEREHFRDGSTFICAEAPCSYSVTRWSDLKRHYTSKHCMSPKTKFPCPELSCKYSGENGFLRKDKMKSHYQTVHEGKAKPGKRFQAIQPKTGSAA